jgi:DNA replication and repair protein RecF
LKLASAAVLRVQTHSGDPVLILDDVFAELDENRRGRLADAVDGFEQVLITAAVQGDVPHRLAAHVVQIRAGRIVADDSFPNDADPNNTGPNDIEAERAPSVSPSMDSSELTGEADAQP